MSQQLAHVHAGVKSGSNLFFFLGNGTLKFCLDLFFPPHCFGFHTLYSNICTAILKMQDSDDGNFLLEPLSFVFVLCLTVTWFYRFWTDYVTVTMLLVLVMLLVLLVGQPRSHRKDDK